MSSAARTQAYLHTRLGILRDRLLPDAFFAELGHAEQLPELPDWLDPTLLTEPLSGDELERRLTRQLLDEVSIVTRPLLGQARDFFRYWTRRFELFNLKTLIRGKLRGLDEREIRGHLLQMPRLNILPIERLLGAEDIDELLRQLAGGPYASLAEQARQVLAERQDIHAIEAAIDQRYYMGIVKRVHHLPDGDRQPTHRLMGSRIDRLNLSWLLRYRFNYGLSPSETYYHLIRHGHQLTPRELLRLVELDDFNAVIAALPASLHEALTGVTNPLQAEQQLDRIVRQRARRVLYREQSSVARAIAYLLLREQQLRRLRTLILGRRYGLAYDTVQAACHCPSEELH